jgi:hypothetical protein
MSNDFSDDRMWSLKIVAMYHEIVITVRAILLWDTEMFHFFIKETKKVPFFQNITYKPTNHTNILYILLYMSYAESKHMYMYFDWYFLLCTSSPFL